MTGTAVRRNGPYAPLGANYADDDAIATLDLNENDRAELLYLRALAYCARDPRTEGYVSDVALRTGKVLARRTGKRNTDSIAQAALDLVDVGLWVREGDGYRIRSWLKWNKTWDEISHGRAKDRDRKRTGTDEESDRSDNGSPTDSARKAHGFQAPGHGSALQGTSRQSTAGQQHATGDAGTRGGGPEAQALLDQHLAHLGPVPAATSRALARHIDHALDDGSTVEAVRAGLTEWRRRPGAKPGLLPHLIGDAARTATEQDPLSHPDAVAFLQARGVNP